MFAAIVVPIGRPCVAVAAVVAGTLFLRCSFAGGFVRTVLDFLVALDLSGGLDLDRPFDQAGFHMDRSRHQVGRRFGLEPIDTMSSAESASCRR